MECLRDFIGLRGCGLATPGSGLYINSLPGITMESFDKIANADQVTYLNVWRDIQTRAIAKFSNAVSSEFKKRFSVKTIHRSVNIGRVIDTTSVTASSNQLRGARINIDCGLESDAYTRSELMQVYFQSISLYLSAVPADPFKLKWVDLTTDTLLYELTINNVAYPLTTGWNLISIEQGFECMDLFYGYDATQINSVELEITSTINSSLCSCVSSFCSDGCGEIKGATLSANYATLDDTTLNSFGLSAIFGLQCSFDRIVCNNKKVFSVPFWYLLGVECMEQRIGEIGRFNIFSLNKEQAEERRGVYGSTFEQELKSIIEGIDLDTSDVCLCCDPQIAYRESLP